MNPNLSFSNHSFWNHSFWWGVLEALLLPLAFGALGLAWWGTALRAEGLPPAYPRALMESVRSTTGEPSVSTDGDAAVWLVDGFNVVQVGLLGGKDRSDWWSEPRRALLLAHASAFEPTGSSVWIVFDGARPAEAEPGGRARLIFAPSADEWLVHRVKQAAEPARLVVVTADRRLAARVRHLGARVASPAEFLGRCALPAQWGDKTSI